MTLFSSLGRNLVKGKILNYNIKKFSSLKMKVNTSTPIINILDADAHSIAANCINADEVIAVPTDTIYGLACNANSEKGVKKIYSIKKRDESKPIAICVSNLEEFRKYGHADHLPEELLAELLPGPVTLVLKQTSLLSNPFLNPGTNLIGIRIPDFGFVRSVASSAGVPVALTSANPSSAPSCLSVEEFSSLHSELKAVFDGGTLGSGRDETRTGSTVVDLSTKGFYKIIRRGIACEETVQLIESFQIARHT